MNKIEKGLLACAFGVMSVVSAEANTFNTLNIRYEFDVIESRPYFFSNGAPFIAGGLFAQDSTGNYNDVPEGSAEYDAVLDAAHPLSLTNNQTFPVILDLEFINESQVHGLFEGFGRFDCVSGPICTSSNQFVGGYQNFVFTDTSPFVPFVSLGPLFPEGTRLSSSSLSFNFDTFGGSIEGIVLNGTQYAWSGTFASFTLDNFSARLLPAPLPASSLLLGAGLIPLAALRRRKNRA